MSNVISDWAVGLTRMHPIPFLTLNNIDIEGATHNVVNSCWQVLFQMQNVSRIRINVTGYMMH